MNFFRKFVSCAVCTAISVSALNVFPVSGAYTNWKTEYSYILGKLTFNTQYDKNEEAYCEVIELDGDGIPELVITDYVGDATICKYDSSLPDSQIKVFFMFFDNDGNDSFKVDSLKYDEESRIIEAHGYDGDSEVYDYGVINDNELNHLFKRTKGIDGSVSYFIGDESCTEEEYNEAYSEYKDRDWVSIGHERSFSDMIQHLKFSFMMQSFREYMDSIDVNERCHYRFDFYDISQNGTPELIAYNMDYGSADIISYDSNNRCTSKRFGLSDVAELRYDKDTKEIYTVNVDKNMYTMSSEFVENSAAYTIRIIRYLNTQGQYSYYADESGPSFDESGYLINVENFENKMADCIELGRGYSFDEMYGMLEDDDIEEVPPPGEQKALTWVNMYNQKVKSIYTVAQMEDSDMLTEKEVMYDIYDINSDGQPELLLSRGYSGYNGCEIYTFDGTNIVEFAVKKEDGSKFIESNKAGMYGMLNSYFYDNMVAVYLHMGTTEFYEIKDNSLIFKYSVTDSPYCCNSDEITEEEYDELTKDIKDAEFTYRGRRYYLSDYIKISGNSYSDVEVSEIMTANKYYSDNDDENNYENRIGNVNGDELVDASDASLILSEYSKFSTGVNMIISEGQIKVADINSDGMIDAGDASLVLAYYSYLSTLPEDEEPMKIKEYSSLS